jgi:hypothetical protein
MGWGGKTACSSQRVVSEYGKPQQTQGPGKDSGREILEIDRMRTPVKSNKENLGLSLDIPAKAT